MKVKQKNPENIGMRFDIHYYLNRNKLEFHKTILLMQDTIGGCSSFDYKNPITNREMEK